jgi:hypothetical protein
VIHRTGIVFGGALLAASAFPAAPPAATARGIVVLVSANAEWKVVRARYPAAAVAMTPYGEWFTLDVPVESRPRPVVFSTADGGRSPPPARPSTRRCAGSRRSS